MSGFSALRSVLDEALISIRLLRPFLAAVRAGMKAESRRKRFFFLLFYLLASLDADTPRFPSCSRRQQNSSSRYDCRLSASTRADFLPVFSLPQPSTTSFTPPSISSSRSVRPFPLVSSSPFLEPRRVPNLPSLLVFRRYQRRQDYPQRRLEWRSSRRRVHQPGSRRPHWRVHRGCRGDGSWVSFAFLSRLAR